MKFFLSCIGFSLIAGLTVRVYILQQHLNAYQSQGDFDGLLQTEIKLLNHGPIDDIILQGEKGTNSLYGVLDKIDPTFLFITGLDDCNLCRDEELNRYNDLYSSNDLNLIMVVTSHHSQALSRKDFARAKGNATFPAYYDVGGNLLQDLNIRQEETPVYLILDKDKTIIAAYRPSTELPHRNAWFQRLTQTLTRKTDET